MMRILLVSHPLLEARYGAAQLTLGLEEGLRQLGHEVAIWSAAREVGSIVGSRIERARGRALASWLRSQASFDIIDVPAIDLQFVPSSSAVVIARSVQPDLLYAREEMLGAIRRHPLRVSTWRQMLLLPGRRRAIERGWRRASLILCLGSLELDWMRSEYPNYSARLSSYVAAPLPSRRKAALELRSRRTGGGSSRALWIGRWSAHKGTELLMRWLGSFADSSPSWHVTVAGCGTPTDRRLAEFVRRGIVRVRPEFDESEWALLLEDHDAGFFTSRVEGWGLGVQEMLEAGLPVFATHAGAIPDLAPYFASQLHSFPPEGDAPDTAPAHRALPREYLETFDWKAIARKYVDEARSSRRTA